MSHLADALLLKRKQIVCTNMVYTLDVATIVKFPPSRSLYGETNVKELHFLFS